MTELDIQKLKNEGARRRLVDERNTKIRDVQNLLTEMNNRDFGSCSPQHFKKVRDLLEEAEKLHTAAGQVC